MVKGNVPSNTSFDTILETGLYAQNADVNGASGLPDGYRHGSLIVFNCGYGTAGGGNPIVQLFFDSALTRPTLVRTKWVSTWYEWKEL